MKDCKISDCLGELYCKGYCGMHYSRWKRTGKPEVRNYRGDRRCELVGCSSKHFGKGYCYKHYIQWKMMDEEYRQKSNAKQRIYRSTDPVYKKWHSRWAKQWQAKNKEKVNAHNAVQRAVAKGILNKPSVCSVCGTSSKIHAHHPDYSKKLHVIWLCAYCHNKIHHPRINREELNFVTQ